VANFLKLKRRVKFILLNWVKYCTKEVAKTLKLVTIGMTIVLTVVCIKYKPGYKVTISGETVGFIENRKVIEAKIEKYINNTDGSVAFREIDELPKYEFKLVDRKTQIDEKEVMLAVKDAITTTYKLYAVTVDGEQKAVVESQEKAENLINEIKSGVNSEIDLKLGIIENYTTEYSIDSEEVAKGALNEIKVAKVTEYETKKAEEAKAAAEAAAAAAKAKKSKSRSYAAATTTAVDPSGNLNGMAVSIPVSGSISSRFGSRSSIRSTVHTGLDIATSSGTGIRPIASGTVVYAAYRGSYGKLIIIDHGNGVQSYYAHCSALYVTPGQAVDTSTTIGAVGSTGNSTGPHLHLEIRLNGQPLNPQNYLY